MCLMSDKNLYNTPESRLNTVVGEKSPLWNNIGMVYRSYQHSKKYDSIVPSFDLYLLNEFGIVIKRGEDGYTWDYDIADPVKYTFFLLKYAS